MRVPTTVLVLSILATACAHTREHAEHSEAKVHDEAVLVETVPVETESTVETAMPRPNPIAAMKRMGAYGKRRVQTNDPVTISPPPDGMAYTVLFGLLAEEAGIRIRYDERNASIKSKKLTFKGKAVVDRSDLIAWAQDTMFYDGLILMHQGPEDRREYVAMDMASPYVASRPTFVSESQLPSLAGRVGLYVSCVLTLPEGVDPQRARTALSQIATKTAGLGRVSDLGKDQNLLVVADFAAVVATMRRALDEMELTLYQESLR